MVLVPAVLVGAFVVFAVGYVLTGTVLKVIEKRRGGNPTFIRGTTVEIKRHGALTEKQIETLSIIGGCIPVALLILSLFIFPLQTAALIWVVLTILGYIGGFLYRSLERNSHG